MKTAFVLAGGGMKGAFQAGVIDSLLESGVKPDFIFGISVGALNAALCAKLVNKSSMNRYPIGSWWMSNVSEPSDFFESKNLIFNIVPSVLRKTFNGLYSHNGLRKQIQKHIRRKDLLMSDIRIKVGAVNLSDGKLYYSSPEDLEFDDYLLASSSIPGILPSVEIDKASYVDGGIRTVAPLKPAIESGAERIIVILCNPESYGAKNYVPGNIMSDIDRYFSIITDAMIVKDIDFAEYVNINLEDPNSFSSKNGKKKLSITLIRPTKEVNVNLTDFDSVRIRDLVLNGRYIGNSKINNLIVNGVL